MQSEYPDTFQYFCDDVERLKKLYNELADATKFSSDPNDICDHPVYKELLEANPLHLFPILYYVLKTGMSSSWIAINLAQDMIDIEIPEHYMGRFCVLRDIMIACLHEETGLNDIVF